MKPHQRLLELSAHFTAQAGIAGEAADRYGAGEVAMLHRGERDAFSACAQMADLLARDLAEEAAAFVPADPPTADDERPTLRQEVARLWAMLRSVDDRAQVTHDNLRGHVEYHKLFTREGSEHIFTRLDKLEKHLDSLSGANEMHASVHNRFHEETKDVREFRDYLIASKFAAQLDTIRARLEAIEDVLRGRGHVGLFGGRQRRSRRA